MDLSPSTNNNKLLEIMSEKLLLKWNDFQENVNTSFVNLKEDKEFADVTLVCEDDQQVEAHKVILAASSPFFENILKKNRHPHPLIYMKGTKIEDLLAILDFLYCGEANVFQEHLDSFLVMAEELKLKGLTAQKDVGDENTNPKEKEIKPKMICKREASGPNVGQTNLAQPILKREKILSTSETNNVASDNEPVPSDELSQGRTISLQDFVSDQIQEHDAKVKSLMEKSQHRASDGKMAFKCRVCEKEGQRFNIRQHIETNHFDRVSTPCNMCGKAFTSKNASMRHQCTFSV